VADGVVRVRVAAPLRLFTRRGETAVPTDGSASLVHLVESVGVPRSEVGGVRVDGRACPPDFRPGGGAVADVDPVTRPQQVAPGGFLLDVHLGALARRLRLLGLDTAYRNDAADAALVTRAVAERRTLLTRDRGLLRRRELTAGAYVRGDDPDAQVADVLDRFRPPLRPWSRCPACNGPVRPVPTAAVWAVLPPGTRRSYVEFSRCADCARVYWRGAHARRLDALVARFHGDPGHRAG
ncbi:MAG TPA: Mut7-C RNAse domain-containing protein, partial [Pilimelia sp.]|nr:Mut7-C RNAse domain-containing protein [Pilimelia sp.]